MNRYPLWKNLLVLIVVLLGAFFSLPNYFGEEPAVQISRNDYQPVTEATLTRVRNTLEREEVPHRAAYLQDQRVHVRFATVDDQLEGRDALDAELEDNHVVALTLSPGTPDWLRWLGLKPVSLGLDLRGGIHFLLEVDMQTALDNALGALRDSIRSQLREERIGFGAVELQGNRIEIALRQAEDLDSAMQLVRRSDTSLQVEPAGGSESGFVVALNEQRLQTLQDLAIEQNITTLRNRVDELGVAEPVVQRQGLNRIVVQLPGLQDPTEAKRLIGRTATLEFRLVDIDNDPYEAERRGRAPLGSELFETREGVPVLLRRDVIATGENLTDATTAFVQEGPAVSVRLDARGGARMLDTTRENLNKPMAVLFIETKAERAAGGETVLRTEKEVISVATIRGVFSNNFQITGLQFAEANDLALLLRAGALAAPVYIVEERTIGPSLGRDNIEQGRTAVVVGFLLVVGFMAMYYRVFGLVANLALLMNLVLIIAIMSLLQASLTLPGIAGIVLTVGMAVDANVLIFERVREELDNGNTPQASIMAGYEKALSSIADANITTLIAAVVLLTFGTGPIRGFAITLSIGILTSMFTAIIGTRAVINLIYGNRRVAALAV